MNPLALVIENDSGTRKLLTVLLTRAGFEVDAVPTGTAAMLLLEQIEYDTVFLDLLMPGVSGGDILDWLTKARPHAVPHVIVLSSTSPAQLQLVRDEWPAMHVFRKPFELEEVIAAAQEVRGSGSRRNPPAVAEQFLRKSVRAGASAGVIVTKSGAVANRVTDFGYAEDYAASYFPLPLASATPLSQSMRDARPVWLPSERQASSEYPQLEGAFSSTTRHAWAVLPLIRDGEVIGAAGWAFGEPRQFTELEQEVLTAIASSLTEWIPAPPTRVD